MSNATTSKSNAIKKPRSYRNLWLGLIGSMTLSFLLLGYYGREIYYAALFGVYGILGIGLMLFCLRGLTRQDAWKSGVLSFSFWSLNLGLVLMIVLSLLPVGLLQTWASV